MPGFPTGRGLVCGSSIGGSTGGGAQGVGSDSAGGYE